MAYPRFYVFVPRKAHDYHRSGGVALSRNRAMAFTVMIVLSLGLWWGIWELLSALTSAWR
jgi:hypothetical protein